MTCIYFKGTPELTYVNQEHIFPAGLGGTKKLNKGVVSDQANEIFSPMEKALMENSLIAMSRMHYGPGKRGSLLETKASQSQVVVSRGGTGLMELTYTALSTPYSISQFTKDNIQYHISLRLPNQMETEIEVFKEFCKGLKNFDSKFVHLQSKELDENQIIIGLHKGKLYCASKGERPKIEIIKKEIDNFLTQTVAIDNKNEFVIMKEEVTQFHRFEESSIIARMYAKTAMNVLAYLKGETFAQADKLDDFRDWILYGKENLYFTKLPNGVFDKKNTKIFPEKAHWCIFTEHDGYPYAIVCFYGMWQRSFKLTKEKQAWFSMPEGYVCDWQRKKEYELNEYFNQVLIPNICRDGKVATNIFYDVTKNNT